MNITNKLLYSIEDKKGLLNLHGAFHYPQKNFEQITLTHSNI